MAFSTLFTIIAITVMNDCHRAMVFSTFFTVMAITIMNNHGAPWVFSLYSLPSWPITGLNNHPDLCFSQCFQLYSLP